MQVLVCLVQHAGEPVSKEELMRTVWPDTFVTDDVLTRSVSELRRVFEDDAKDSRVIQTIPKRGYRFIGSLAASSGLIRSLLVLPLENLSGDPEQEYFADGLTEELITKLARIIALRVLSRTTAMHYKGVRKPLPEIARELQVDGIVEGTVLRSGERVRISAQLIHAPTDTHLWAESYDRELRDVLALQSEVARAIASEIQVKLTPLDHARFGEVHPVVPEAYEAYLKGRYHWNRRSKEGFGKAREYYQQAITKDPAFAAAYSGLADCLSVLTFWGVVPPDEGFGKTKRLALQALELDPSLAEAHASLAFATVHYDYDFLAAEREFERSIELNPRYATAHHWFGWCLAAMGRYEEGYTELKRAIRLDPHFSNAHFGLGFVSWYARRYDLAIEEFEKALELDPDAPHSYWGLGSTYLCKSLHERAIAAARRAVKLSQEAPIAIAFLGEAYAAAGQSDEAYKILEQFRELSKQRSVMPYFVGRIYAALGKKDEAFHWLETAYQERDAWMVFLKTDPRLDNLRPDPRFQDLLRRMNFPP
jgi:TolB-like protein/tetratricopeptide (TPR) repeat protein